MRKITMHTRYNILRYNPQTETYIEVTNPEVVYISAGAYNFTINTKPIPFDWKTSSSIYDYRTQNDFDTLTGYGAFRNEKCLVDCYDEEYAAMGLSREDITAEFLASATGINEFHLTVDFHNQHDVDIGLLEANSDENSKYRLRLLSVEFIDEDTGETYSVGNDVLYRFNNGML